MERADRQGKEAKVTDLADYGPDSLGLGLVRDRGTSIDHGHQKTHRIKHLYEAVMHWAGLRTHTR